MNLFDIFGGKDPLKSQPVLDVDIPGLERVGSGKVTVVFRMPDGNLIFIATDRIGAFDQPHLTQDGQPAHYPGKGMILTAFQIWGKTKAALPLIPTDFIPLESCLDLIPSALRNRATLHLPANRRIDVEFVVRSSNEGSMTGRAEICGQKLPSNLKLGQLLDRPYFTPTTKAPKGQKDVALTLEKYVEVVGDDDLANYLYGISVLLHLINRGMALSRGLDRPDQKMEFGIFDPTAPIFLEQLPIKRMEFVWSEDNTKVLFNNLCGKAGFLSSAWINMPMFDLRRFCRFAQTNYQSVRLIDEYGGTDDGRYRALADTVRARELMAAGEVYRGKALMQEYLCKEYFRLASKRTGQGGYEQPAQQAVIIPKEVLIETGRRNLTACQMLLG